MTTPTDTDTTPADDTTPAGNAATAPDPARVAALAARLHAVGTVILGIQEAVRLAARAYVAYEVAAGELTEEQAAKLLGSIASA